MLFKLLLQLIVMMMVVGVSGHSCINRPLTLFYIILFYYKNAIFNAILFLQRVFISNKRQTVGGMKMAVICIIVSKRSENMQIK